MVCLLLDIGRQATHKFSVIRRRPFPRTEDQEASFNDDLPADLGDLPRDYNVWSSRSAPSHLPAAPDKTGAFEVLTICRHASELKRRGSGLGGDTTGSALCSPSTSLRPATHTLDSHAPT